ncbi:hypothetical protein ASC66_10315 [Leifsonia sp. Root4]|uniref:MmcQ/YjbR family DNA-binding protein n=1 Tax=Leifsonia sp. Root4 TaxID=1736525 RepID=UPI0007017BA3|nr:MmcQ/YjbR family DNA-binding protein [Leifsonia sp. Root4]KQW05403.1 hypothetical protein ASC66_10315 [Leifsonia sp. Root4]
MTPDELAAFCLNLPQAIETYPFGEQTTVFKTSGADRNGDGKIFALSVLDAEPLTVSLKCDPEEGKALREEFPTHISPGYHLNKKHWLTLVLDGTLDDALIEQLLRDSHALVRPKVPRAPRAASTA